MKLKEIAKKLNGKLTGNGEIEITGISTIEEAKEGEIAPLYRRKFLPLIKKSAALAFLTGEGFELPGRNFIVVKNPRASLAALVRLFHSEKEKKGISRTARISPGVEIGKDVFIGEFVVIGEGSKIGDNTEIHSGTIIYEDVAVGKNCRIYSNVSIREGTRIGNEVIIHPGVVIGADGFGFEEGKKIPQIGVVIIGNDVEIGANTCIDRAALGTTEIKNGVKIDNLCQIGHGVKIGEGTLIAGMTGIGGSTKIGRGVIIGGMAGIRDNIEIGDRAMIAARAGVTKSVPSGQIVSGFPHTDIKTWRKAIAHLYRLARKGGGEGGNKG